MMTEQLTADERGFLAPDRDLLDEGYLLLDYVFETSDAPLKAAVHLCREQSTALWARPGVDEDYRPKHAAKVVDLQTLGHFDKSSSGKPATGSNRGACALDHPRCTTSGGSSGT